MRIFDLALKDLRQILRERQSAFFLLIMPIAFTLLFGFAFGGFTVSDTEDPRLPVGLFNQDDGLLAQKLVVLLEQSDVLRLVMDQNDQEALTEQLEAGDLAAVIIVPADFGVQMEADSPVPLSLMVGSGNATSFTIQGEIEATVSRLADARQIGLISTETAVAVNLLPDSAAETAYYQEALERAVAAWSDSPLRVRTSTTGAIVSSETDVTAVYGSSAFAHTSPGMMAQFTLAGLITAAQILVQERKNGSLRRLLTTNMSPFSILVGHYLAMFIMIVAQILILIVFGQLLLKLPYFQQPVATLVMVIASALFAAAMGLLIGALAKSEEQAIVFSLVPMFILSGLGGAWMPLEFTPAAVQRIAYLTPVAWMVDGFKDIVVRGQGVESVLTAVAVLLAYGLVFWLLAAWRFRFE